MDYVFSSANPGLAAASDATKASWQFHVNRCKNCPDSCVLDDLWSLPSGWTLADKILSIQGGEIKYDQNNTPYIECSNEFEILLNDTWRDYWPYSGLVPGGFFISFDRLHQSTGYIECSVPQLPYQPEEDERTLPGTLIATAYHTYYKLYSVEGHGGEGGLLAQGITNAWQEPFKKNDGWMNFAITGSWAISRLGLFAHGELLYGPRYPYPNAYVRQWLTVEVGKHLAPQNITSQPSIDLATNAIYPLTVSCGARSGPFSLPRRIWGEGPVRLYNVYRCSLFSLQDLPDFLIRWLLTEEQRELENDEQLVYRFNSKINTIPNTNKFLPPYVYPLEARKKKLITSGGVVVWDTIAIYELAALVFGSPPWTSDTVNEFLNEYEITTYGGEFETKDKITQCKKRNCVFFVSNGPADRWFRTSLSVNGDRSILYPLGADGDELFEPSEEYRALEKAKMYREMRVHIYGGDANDPDKFTAYVACTGSINGLWQLHGQKTTGGYNITGVTTTFLPFGRWLILAVQEQPDLLVVFTRADSDFAQNQVLFTSQIYRNEYISTLEAAALGTNGPAPDGSYVSGAYLPYRYARETPGQLTIHNDGQLSQVPRTPCMQVINPERKNCECRCRNWPETIFANISVALQVQKMSWAYDEQSQSCTLEYGVTNSVYKTWLTVGYLKTVESGCAVWVATPVVLKSSVTCPGWSWPSVSGDYEETVTGSFPFLIRISPVFFINERCELIGLLKICIFGCPLRRANETWWCYDWSESGTKSQFAEHLLTPGGVYAVDTDPIAFSLESCGNSLGLGSEVTTESTSAEGNQEGPGEHTHIRFLTVTFNFGKVDSDCDFDAIISAAETRPLYCGSATISITGVE